MFDIGWTEMLVIAVVMIVVVGPKDLPKMLRTFGRTTAKLRAMAGDFQKQFNEALKEAELDDVKKSIDALRGMNPANEIKKSLNPFEKAAADVRAGLQSLQNPPKPAEPASPAAVAAEPLKNGATAMPGSEPTAPSAVPIVAPAAQPAAVQPAAGISGAPASTSTNGSAAAAAAPKAPRKAAAQPKMSATSAEASVPAEKKTKAAAAKAPAAAGAKAPAKPRKTAGSST
jgi:sec-independent protein translocase protein TatB